ncbi:DUF4260 domain-containing protein [Paracoccus sp. SCSIO 75233]|uniref:DUF4260 domain-containing protein n=1 Tax=Paracoccus sp. SCSIO 75233 TaxID=3017782 RepID=UPI0022F0CF7F|nr:DUF4260 domain-containing protein [Paracoccus sp. SCSIO 75233]WBU51817.1 DUF4260 domain-containing protein [Paracoccus sp. SCSIO 75233]
MTGVVIWQRVEGAVIFLAGLWVVNAIGTGLPWWALLLLFFAPDIGFAGYALGPKVGAAVYNILHFYGFGLLLLMLGSVSGSSLMIALGALWFAHAGLDRMLGYGLKTGEGFSHTHLGRIGRGG